MSISARAMPTTSPERAPVEFVREEEARTVRFTVRAPADVAAGEYRIGATATSAGETFGRGMLRDPEAMYPGQRRMVNNDFTEAEIDDLVAFFQWIGQIDTNGFPADPPLADHLAGASGAPAGPLVFQQTCTACHAVDGRGGNIGPALDGVGDRFDAEYLGRWLTDPASVRPETTMPQLGLSDAQVEELVTYLSTLRAEG